jgi:PKD domain
MRSTFRFGFLLFAIFLLAITFSAQTRAFSGKGANPLSWFSNFLADSFMRSSVPAVTPTPVTFAPIEGVAFTGTVATFTSPDNSFSATIDWGDGTTTAGTVSGGSGSFSISGTHTYAEDGTYNVPVTIHDNTDSTNTPVTSTANVVEQTLSLTALGPFTIAEGSLFSQQVATFHDPSSPDPASFFGATINWGDGTTTTGTLTGSAGNYQISGSHIYADE